MTTSHEVAIVGFPTVQLLDVAGPLEVFDLASRFRPGAYRVELVTSDGEPLTTSSGLRLAPHARLADRTTGLDTVIVAGGNGTVAALGDETLIDWLRGVAPGCRRVASVCSGAFLLAQAGLLAGRRATTHWSVCDELERWFPDYDRRCRRHLRARRQDRHVGRRHRRYGPGPRARRGRPRSRRGPRGRTLARALRAATRWPVAVLHPTARAVGRARAVRAICRRGSWSIRPTTCRSRPSRIAWR